jgi:hypothetical protein
VVLGNQGSISPLGTVGELHIFGAGLSKGYLRSGVVTEPFVSHPLKYVENFHCTVAHLSLYS